MPVVAYIPVKRFFVAKKRLAGALAPSTRSRLGRDLAAHTMAMAAEAGAEPVVLAADAEVAAWAEEQGTAAVVDTGNGLDAAAGAAVALAVETGRTWMILHADLPLLRPNDLEPALAVLRQGGEVIAPAKDGGTSLIGAARTFRFAYGPGSFHRHLARLTNPAVVVRLGLSLDLDDGTDLAAARLHPSGAWLGRYPALP